MQENYEVYLRVIILFVINFSPKMINSKKQ